MGARARLGSAEVTNRQTCSQSRGLMEANLFRRPRCRRRRFAECARPSEEVAGREDAQPEGRATATFVTCKLERRLFIGAHEAGAFEWPRSIAACGRPNDCGQRNSGRKPEGAPREPGPIIFGARLEGAPASSIWGACPSGWARDDSTAIALVGRLDFCRARALIILPAPPNWLGCALNSPTCRRLHWAARQPGRAAI